MALAVSQALFVGDLVPKKTGTNWALSVVNICVNFRVPGCFRTQGPWVSEFWPSVVVEPGPSLSAWSLPACDGSFQALPLVLQSEDAFPYQPLSEPFRLAPIWELEMILLPAEIKHARSKRT